jgi:hypothetical protein
MGLSPTYPACRAKCSSSTFPHYAINSNHRRTIHPRPTATISPENLLWPKKFVKGFFRSFDSQEQRRVGWEGPHNGRHKSTIQPSDSTLPGNLYEFREVAPKDFGVVSSLDVGFWYIKGHCLYEAFVLDGALRPQSVNMSCHLLTIAQPHMPAKPPLSEGVERVTRHEIQISSRIPNTH